MVLIADKLKFSVSTAYSIVLWENYKSDDYNPKYKNGKNTRIKEQQKNHTMNYVNFII